MQAETAPPAFDAVPDRNVLIGRVIAGLVVLFLLFDASLKLVPFNPVIDAAVQIMWPTNPWVWRGVGSILLVSTLLYACPRTSLLGAILLTAYLGGAVATHARVGAPLFSHTLFGVYIGIALWGALWLREPRLRALLR